MSKTSRKDSNNDQTESFEARLNKLEQLVEALESGELELADSLDRFQQGVKLSNQCRDMLDQAQQTIEKLSDPDDEKSARPFDPIGSTE